MLMKVIKAALQFFLYAVFVLLALVSVPLFQENVFLGLAFNGPAFLYILLRALNVIRKSRVAVGFMLFGLGMLEIHLGVAKGYPVFWVIGLAVFLASFLYTWIRAEVQGVSQNDAIADKDSGALGGDSLFHNRLFDPVGTPKTPGNPCLFQQRHD